MKLLWNFLLIPLSFLLLASSVQAESVAAPSVTKKPVFNSDTPPVGPSKIPVLPENPSSSSPQEIKFQKLAEADKLYLEGQLAAAEKLYREVKAPFSSDSQEATINRSQPTYDVASLSATAQVYWRQSQEGLNDPLPTKSIVSLQLLVKEYPEFIPGHLRLAEVLRNYTSSEEALRVLERACTLYPQELSLLQARIAALSSAEKWLEASLAARQFALMNPQHPQASELTQVAEENLKKFRSYLRNRLQGNAIGSFLTTAAGVAFTGNPFLALSAVETTVLLLKGESGIGETIADAAKRELKIVKDEAVQAYLDRLGQKLAKVAGRDEFKYEFFVVLDEKINAFALPGGKVFINAGAIAKANSEAELAGLISHELSHAVLSHGYQLVVESSLVESVTQFIPFGGTISDLAFLNYSREMERQADVLGTRILVAAGYAADGLYNLMVTLKQEDKTPEVLSFLSTHPDTDERIRYLQELITRNGYNRYAYEGVVQHAEIKAKVKALLEQKKKHQS